MRLRFALFLLSSCATVDGARRDERCRQIYDTCLTDCPTADVSTRAPPGLTRPNPDPLDTVRLCADSCTERLARCQRAP